MAVPGRRSAKLTRQPQPPAHRIKKSVMRKFIIKRHAEISGFPANTITEIRRLIDPTTEKA
jgi:hypothetical protein